MGLGCSAGRGEGEGLASRVGEGAGGTQTKGTSAAAAATTGGGDGGREGGGLAVPLWCCPRMAAAGRGRQGPAVRGEFDSATVAIAAKRAGGPVWKTVLPDYGKTMTTHDDVASRYPTETMVKAACTPDFTIPPPPKGSGTGSSGSQASP